MPRIADSSICNTVRLTAGSRINFGWLTRPYSRRMFRYNTVPTVLSILRMRASRSSPLGLLALPLMLPSVGSPLPEALGELFPLARLRPFVPLEDPAELLSPFLPEGRIPLRQFSGRAQANNAGVLIGWRFWSRSTQTAWKSQK